MFAYKLHTGLVCIVCIMQMCISGTDIDSCIVYKNAKGDLEQIPMEVTNGTDVSRGIDVNLLTRGLCTKASTLHLTLVPGDLSALSDTPSRLHIMYLFRNDTLLMSHFWSVDISTFQNFTQINCWFGIPVSDQVIIHVIVKVTGKDEREVTFIGDKLIIPNSDANTCTGPCQENDIDFKTIYTCLSNSTLTHSAHVRIIGVTFTSLSGNSRSLAIHRQSDQYTTVYLAHVYNDTGIMEVTYTDSELYCSVSKVVRLFCDSALTTTSPAADHEFDSFGTFVIFGLVTMSVFTVIIVLIIFVIQKFTTWRKLCCDGKDKAKQDHHQHRTALLLTNTERVIKKSALRKIVEINELQSLVNDGSSEIQRKFTHTRTTSTSQSNTSFPQGLRYDYDSPACGRKLQRSVTQALLQNMDSTSTSILLLPLPFDQFTRDIVELLGTVLTMEADIPTRYCFDRDVQAEYFRDAHAYISDVCSDQTKLLIFVCVTHLANLPLNKSEEPISLINDLLRAIDVQNIEPMCKIVFLHLTDDDKMLKNKYHGLDIHIKQENSFERFLAVVLKECGKNAEDNNLLNKLVTCEAAEHFVRYLKEGHI
ncbi:uncharacterized protein LOC127845870 isoform X2 [Dreissena polymorpha]|uniref:uncharacterized protein LOC127845870 isoform X2 n=1 Tax=Dreissena polymorpha TaxID=45954 RepID=UPI0022644E90|nr:uncharacterized protein LOC127845870 isoform X2 [Dreissena polymorpha]